MTDDLLPSYPQALRLQPVMLRSWYCTLTYAGGHCSPSVRMDLLCPDGWLQRTPGLL